MSCMSATDGRERARHEEGTAIILALVATVLLSALGVGLVLMSNTETAPTELLAKSVLRMLWASRQQK